MLKRMVYLVTSVLKRWQCWLRIYRWNQFRAPFKYIHTHILTYLW